MGMSTAQRACLPGQEYCFGFRASPAGLRGACFRVQGTGTRLAVQGLVGLPAGVPVQRAAGADVVQRDAQLPGQHRQRVAVDAGDDAAAQVRCALEPLRLPQAPEPQ